MIGGGIYQELKTFTDEEFLHAHGCLDGLLGELEVEVVGEQRLELQTNQGTLGNHGPVLLLDGEEMLMGILVGEDNGLTAKGTNLRATDIKDVAMASQIGQGNIITLSHQTIAETGTIDIKRYLIMLADLIDIIELTGCVEGSKFCGEGDIHQARVDGMILVAIVHVVIEVFI